jgi:hypothetical protein
MYHAIAPDFPGLVFTTAVSDFPYTFANTTDVIKGFLDVLCIQKLAAYRCLPI